VVFAMVAMDISSDDVWNRNGCLIGVV